MDKKIIDGLELLLKYDRYLLEVSSSERSITHRLGMYYQSIFKGFDVDCEYNMNLTNPKVLSLDPHLLLEKIALAITHKLVLQSSDLKLPQPDGKEFSYETLINLREQLNDKSRLELDNELDVYIFTLEEANGTVVRKRIYPDIIIHKRGTENNLGVIEAKKSTNTGRRARAFDIFKLITLLEDPSYRYENAYFIDIPVKKDFITHTNFLISQSLYDSRLRNITSKMV